MISRTQISDTIAFDITPIDKDLSKKVLGYYLVSTATIYVEDTHSEPDKRAVEKEVKNIASHLINSDEPQLTIAIHGYANTKSDTQKRDKNIYEYAKNICTSNNVFVGYRWPAENPAKDDPEPANSKPKSFLDKIKFALQSLPTLLLGILISTLILGITTVSLLLIKPTVFNLVVTFLSIFLVSTSLSFLLSRLGEANRFLPPIPNGLILVFFASLIGAIATHTLTIPINSDSLLVLLAVLFVLFFGVVLALIALRLSTYPGDRYRASNYGVIDLVEFIRQLDQALIEKACEQAGIPQCQWSDVKKIEDERINKDRVRLSFISHSLGCEVVTQTIRILSDVFEPNSIEISEENLTGKDPSSKIGRVFSLGRLVLVAPDIPVESILSGRANFLRSSLRRCEEAYVFSNEADLALRLASTAANYFSFPARTRFRGYKLGNVTAKHFINKFDCRNRRLKDDEKYGIINLNKGEHNYPYKNIEVRASNLEHRRLDELLQSEKEESEKQILEEEAVADFFTYFDCTDYVDFKGAPTKSDPKNGKPEGVVSHAPRRSALNLWWDYIILCFAYFFSIPRHINVHGGYFEGKFSQRLIYDIAFLGFKGCLTENFNGSLNDFSKDCQNKGIQVVLASKDLPKAPSGESPCHYR
ncbi:hypothetical protein [Nostoc sp.]|uniref:hypothetical protein n=1 Tax=Nostoc sp. TaxID=1180 RepID=UPI0035930C61